MKKIMMTVVLMLGMSMAASACEDYQIEYFLGQVCINILGVNFCYNVMGCMDRNGSPLNSKVTIPMSVAPWALPWANKKTVNDVSSQIEIKKPEETTVLVKKEEKTTL